MPLCGLFQLPWTAGSPAPGCARWSSGSFSRTYRPHRADRMNRSAVAWVRSLVNACCPPGVFSAATRWGARSRRSLYAVPARDPTSLPCRPRNAEWPKICLQPSTEIELSFCKVLQHAKRSTKRFTCIPVATYFHAHLRPLRAEPHASAPSGWLSAAQQAPLSSAQFSRLALPATRAGTCPCPPH